MPLREHPPPAPRRGSAGVSFAHEHVDQIAHCSRHPDRPRHARRLQARCPASSGETHQRRLRRAGMGAAGAGRFDGAGPARRARWSRADQLAQPPAGPAQHPAVRVLDRCRWLAEPAADDRGGTVAGRQLGGYAAPARHRGRCLVGAVVAGQCRQPLCLRRGIGAVA